MPAVVDPEASTPGKVEKKEFTRFFSGSDTLAHRICLRSGLRLAGPRLSGNGSAPAEVDLAAVAALSDGGLWVRPTRSRVEPGWADCLPTLIT